MTRGKFMYDVRTEEGVEISPKFWVNNLLNRFCNMFSESSLACWGIMAAAVRPNGL